MSDVSPPTPNTKSSEAACEELRRGMAASSYDCDVVNAFMDSILPGGITACRNFYKFADEFRKTCLPPLEVKPD